MASRRADCRTAAVQRTAPAGAQPFAAASAAAPDAPHAAAVPLLARPGAQPIDVRWHDGHGWAVRASAADPLARAWDALAAQAATPNPYAERWFVAAGLALLAAPGDVHLLAVHAGTAADAPLIGILPLCLRRHYGRLPLVHVENWLHANAFLGTPLVRAGDEAAFWAAALAAIDAARFARGLVHLSGLAADGPVFAGLRQACAAQRRPLPIVLSEARAALHPAGHSPASYWEAAVRGKKRKELRRQEARLADLGTVAHLHGLAPGQGIADWCDAFLALEAAGWKGEGGSALAHDAAKAAFFRRVIGAAHAHGRADLRAITLDGHPIAMLVHFLCPPHGFSFKTAYCEDLARFSPGVLIQRDNLALIAAGDLALIDSCAAPGHPMIDSLWRERRTIVRVTMPLRARPPGGRFGPHALARRCLFLAVRAVESGWHALRRPSRPAAVPGPQPARTESVP